MGISGLGKWTKSFNFRNDLEEAQRFYERAAVIYEKYCPEERLNDKSEPLARIYSNLGKVCFYQDNFDAAITYIQKSLQISQSLQLKELLPKTQNILHTLYLKKLELECSKLHPENDATLIKKKQEEFVVNLINLAKTSVDPALTKKCLDHLLKEHPDDYLKEKTKIYELLIKFEEQYEPKNLEAITQYTKEISKINTQLMRQDIDSTKKSKETSDDSLKQKWVY